MKEMRKLKMFFGLTLLLSFVIVIGVGGPMFGQEKYEVKLITWDMPGPMWMVIQSEVPPNIKVTYQLASAAQMRAKALTQMVSKEPPDIIEADAMLTWANWAYQGLLNPIDEFIERDNYDLSVFKPSTRDYFVTTGPDGKKHRYAIPYLANSQEVWLLNTDMFDESGVDRPTNNDTWDDFLQDSLRLTKDLDGDGTPEIWGFSWRIRYFHSLLSWAATNGTDGWTSDGKVEYDDPRFIRAVQFLMDLTFKHKVAPIPELEKWRNWYDGKIAQVFTYHGRLDNNRRGESFFAWDVRLPPKGPDGPRRLPVCGESYVMTANSRNKEAAWEVLKVIYGEKYLEGLFLGGDWDGLPTATHRRDIYEPQSTPEYREELMEIMPYPTLTGLEALDRYVEDGYIPYWSNQYLPPEVQLAQTRFESLWGRRRTNENIANVLEETSALMNVFMDKVAK